MPPFEPLAELSAAARRVVDAVRQKQTGDLLIHPATILRAIWDDGSRGAEILENGFGEPAFLLELDWLDTESAPPSSGFLDHVVTEARAAARLLGRQHEVGTEHLLAGVLAVVPPLANRWSERGLDLDRIRIGQVHRESQPHHPIEVGDEFRLRVSPPTEDASVSRILDAAANRCREGLRVVEDFVRFALDDAGLSERLKRLRHQLAETLGLMNSSEWISFRDTPGDVGTAISTAAERYRSTADDVVLANCKRVEEALRTLEEFGKLRDPRGGARIEALRYQFYAIEQSLAARRGSQQRLASAHLYLLATDSTCATGLANTIQGALAGGVDIVQLREKNISDQRSLVLAGMVREWTRAAGKLFIVNDRPDLAALVDADGVHLGQDDLPVAAARKIVGSRALIGVSTHTIDQARRAVAEGADYLGIGPVFTSKTKDFHELAGLEFVEAVAAEIRIPWFAIGGITADNLEQVMAAGATRVAVSSAICSAGSPPTASRQLKESITQRTQDHDARWSSI